MDLSAVVNTLSDRVPHGTDEYMGEDGLLRCGLCHTPVQTRVSFLGIEKTVRCICQCIIARQEIEKETKKAIAREYRRKLCFEKPWMFNFTFENDSRDDARLSDAMIEYTEQFEDFRKQGKGLLLSGNVGTGKSYLAACIANRLIDKGYHCRMTNFSTLINKIQSSFEGRQEAIDELDHFDLLILDDLGAERKTEYMDEQVFSIIDARYRTGLPFIITTNISLEDIKKPEDLTQARIYDRILERCHPIKVEGASKRRQSVLASYDETKKRLGL